MKDKIICKFLTTFLGILSQNPTSVGGQQITEQWYRYKYERRGNMTYQIAVNASEKIILN